MEKITLDLNDIASGRVELNSFKEKLNGFDLSQFKDQHVQLKGCAPTWAHLLVAAKLFPITHKLDFVIDDGGNGKVVELQ